MTHRLTTDRLTLRRVRPSDLDALHGIFRLPEAMRYWSTPAHADIAETGAWLDRWLSAGPDRGSDDFIIERDGRVIGKAGAWRLPEVGFMLHPDDWGQGYASEAMRAVIAHLLATHQVPRLTAEADPRNTASLNLLARLGFTETHRAEKVFQWGDEWCDSVYFALQRPGARD